MFCRGVAVMMTTIPPISLSVLGDQEATGADIKSPPAASHANNVIHQDLCLAYRQWICHVSKAPTCLLCILWISALFLVKPLVIDHQTFNHLDYEDYPNASHNHHQSVASQSIYMGPNFLLLPFVFAAQNVSKTFIQLLVTLVYIHLFLAFRLGSDCYAHMSSGTSCADAVFKESVLSQVMLCLMPGLGLVVAFGSVLSLEIHARVLLLLQGRPCFDSATAVATKVILLSALIVVKYWHEAHLWGLFVTLQRNKDRPVDSHLNVAEIVDLLGRALSNLETLSILPLARISIKLMERSLCLISGDRDSTSKGEVPVESQDLQDLLDVYSGHHVLRQILNRNLSWQSEEDQSHTVRPPSSANSFEELDQSVDDMDPQAFQSLIPPPPPAPSNQRSASDHAGIISCVFPLLETFKTVCQEDGLPGIDLRLVVEDLMLSEQWEVPELSELQGFDDDFYPLLTVGYQYLAPYLGMGLLDASEECLRTFLWYLENMYPNNPYHNAFHGALVMHAATWMAGVILESDWIPRDRVSLAIAALAHDAGHPARTNGFLCTVGSPLALLYNDISVLENYHSSLLFSILAEPSCNILASAPRQDVYYFRRLCIQVIIATDMSRHFEFMTQSKVKLISNTDDKRMPEEDRLFLFCLILKAGDLSHTAISWHSHELWSSRVQQEFFLQGDAEREQGLPISPLCDHLQLSKKEYAKSQVSFIQFVAQPLYVAIEALDKSGRLRTHCLYTIERNRERWELRQNEVLQGEETWTRIV